MEQITVLLIPALFAALLVRCLLLPIRWFWKLGLHSLCGFACLWILNSVGAFTGVLFPINAVTVAVAGFLGLPGIGLLTLLEVL